MLAAVSGIKVPPRSDTKQSTSLSRNLPSPQPTTSGLFSESGHYKSEEGIQKWLQKSTSFTMESVMTEDNQTVDQSKKNVNDFEVPKRKVSDFEVPKKAPRKPPTPLVLKKPSPHLYNLPSIVKTDLEGNGTVKWVQREPTGSQTEVLWASRPTSYNVKFSSLPKRLLEREGSIDKMRDDCVLPQTKQIEILKREYGRFPGLKVPQTLRGTYSFDVQQQDTAAEKVDIKKEDNGGDEHGNTNNDDTDT